MTVKSVAAVTAAGLGLYLVLVVSFELVQVEPTRDRGPTPDLRSEMVRWGDGQGADYPTMP